MTEEIKAGQTNQEQSKKVSLGLGQVGEGVALRDAVSELLGSLGDHLKTGQS